MTRKKKKRGRILFVIFAVFIALEAFGFFLASHGSGSYKAVSVNSLRNSRLREISLKRRISRLVPKGIYLVIDTAKNRLYVKRGERTLKEVVVSTGSGSILNDPTGKRQWVFDTPRGERTILSRTTNPVWTKPDWAFIEEGEEVPTSFKDRVEEGVLGDYAFHLGNGYMIHGTLYTRLLGRNVTHGCVRVGDKDLKGLNDIVSIGTKVIIF